MHLLTHGVDIVHVDRIAQMLREHGERFMDRCFSPGEQEYCNSMKNFAQHYAARFAAKEAVLKALGKGLADGIEWTNVEVVRQPTGQPTIRISGRAAEIAAERGISSFLLSLSHTETDAIASVIACGQ